MNFGADCFRGRRSVWDRVQNFYHFLPLDLRRREMRLRRFEKGFEKGRFSENCQLKRNKYKTVKILMFEAVHVPAGHSFN